MERQSQRETDGEGRGLLALPLSPEPGGPCVTHALLACTAQACLGLGTPLGPRGADFPSEVKRGRGRGERRRGVYSAVGGDRPSVCEASPLSPRAARGHGRGRLELGLSLPRRRRLEGGRGGGGGF